MRSAKLHINYNGKNITESLMHYVTNLSYTDAASGELDDLSITVSDQDNKWINAWSPTEGDKISAAVEVFDWQYEGQVMKLPFGTFHVDSLSFAGPPDTVIIKAASFPVTAEIRQVRRSKVWETVKLSTIAYDIANRAKLTLVREIETDATYERLEQDEQTDFSFLLEQTKKEGIACKVVEGKLVLYDEAKYEKGKSVATYERGKDKLLDYSFDWSSSNCAYRACEVTYELTQKGKKKAATMKATYMPPGAPKTGPILRVKENAKSQADALRIGKNRLREKNKQANLGSITVFGDIRIATGVIITIKGFGRFDGKYIVDQATHQVNGSGYKTTMNIRKVLGW